jgi:hypothetical protein
MFRPMLVLAAAGALALPAGASAKQSTFMAQAYQTSDTPAPPRTSGRHEDDRKRSSV